MARRAASWKHVLALAFACVLSAGISHGAASSAAKLAGEIDALFKIADSYDQSDWKSALGRVDLADSATRDALTPVVQSAAQRLISEGDDNPNFIEGLMRDQKRLLAKVMMLQVLAGRLGPCLDATLGQNAAVAEKYSRYRELLDDTKAKQADKWTAELAKAAPPTARTSAKPEQPASALPTGKQTQTPQTVSIVEPASAPPAVEIIKTVPPKPAGEIVISRRERTPPADSVLAANHPPVRQASDRSAELAGKIGEILGPPDSFDESAWKAAFKQANLKDPAARGALAPTVQAAAQALIDEGSGDADFDQELSRAQERLLVRVMKLDALYTDLGALLDQSAGQDVALAQKYSGYYDLLDAAHAKRADRWRSELAKLAR